MASQELHHPSAPPVNPTEKELHAARGQDWNKGFQGLANFAERALAASKIEPPVYDLDKSR